MYPHDDTLSRDFDDNFFWRQVRIPKADGSKKDSDKEQATISPGMKGLFNVICVPEDIRQDYTEYEEDGDADDDIVSTVSTVAGVEVENPMEDDNSDTEEPELDTDTRIETSLKHLGNVQRKKRSPLLLKELLGDDGDDAMHGMKEKHLKALARTQNRINTVKLVNRHFENKLKQRMDALEVVIHDAANKTFPRRNRRWKSQFKEVMAERRQSRINNNN